MSDPKINMFFLPNTSAYIVHINDPINRPKLKLPAKSTNPVKSRSHSFIKITFKKDKYCISAPSRKSMNPTIRNVLI